MYIYECNSRYVSLATQLAWGGGLAHTSWRGQAAMNRELGGCQLRCEKLQKESSCASTHSLTAIPWAATQAIAVYVRIVCFYLGSLAVALQR